VAKVKEKSSSGLSIIVKELLKEFGDEIVWAPDQDRAPIEVIPTKLIGINWALARGGFPRGRVSEISGKESSGKTTIGYHIIKCVQQSGGIAAFIDVENSLDMVYMKQCGVDEKNLILLAPDYGEQALDAVERLVEKNIDLVVVDSVAALIPKTELEGDITDMQIGLQARLMAKSMRRLNTLLKGTKTAVIFTNQLRDTIGGFGFGPHENTPGGRALKHSAAVRISTTRTTPIKVGAATIGFITRVRILKNKVGIPGRQVEVPIVFGYGLDERLDLVNLSVKCGFLKKRASIYYMKNKALGNGWLQVYNRLTKSVRVMQALDTKISAKLEKITSGSLTAGADDKE